MPQPVEEIKMCRGCRQAAMFTGACNLALRLFSAVHLEAGES
jgi:hypothetical protein